MLLVAAPDSTRRDPRRVRRPLFDVRGRWLRLNLVFLGRDDELPNRDVPASFSQPSRK